MTNLPTLDATTVDTLIATAVERSLAEIKVEVAIGRIPASVADFAELHDFIDANELGGMTDETGPWQSRLDSDFLPTGPEGTLFADRDEMTDAVNAVQDQVDAAIKAGALRA